MTNNYMKLLGKSFTLLLIIIILSACAGHKQAKSALPRISSAVDLELVSLARASAENSMKATGKLKAKDFAEQGITHANNCIKLAPSDAGCYYWRAVNTGLYHKVWVLGYQRGVKKMIEDCNKVISLDSSYDHAGAYRILGQIYTQLPQTGGRPDSIIRDLPFAEKNLREAVRLSPDYPENHLALADTLFAEEKPVEAKEYLAKAKSLVPDWQSDISYNDWHISMKSLEKKIAKKTK